MALRERRVMLAARLMVRSAMRSLAAVLLGGMLVNACGTAPAAVPTVTPVAAVTSPLLIRVGAASITRADFDRFYQPGMDPAQLYDQLIEVELVVQAAAAAGVTVDLTRIAAEEAQLRQQQNLADDAAQLAYLQQNGIGSLEEFHNLLARDQLVEAMLLRQTQLEHAKARHILLTANQTDGEQVRQQAEQLLAELEAGADFAALARRWSADTASAPNGGDLGYVPRGLLAPVMEEALFALQPGQRTIVQTDSGWHVIELLEAPALRNPVARALLETPVGEQAVMDSFVPWVAGLRRAAEDAGLITIVVPLDQLDLSVAP
jgi:peptidyl-prolyl cis-trans isomerase C